MIWRPSGLTCLTWENMVSVVVVVWVSVGDPPIVLGEGLIEVVGLREVEKAELVVLAVIEAERGVEVEAEV